ncbi:hypothetical protein PSTG_00882 [Puccinia striiformis f. sp. tritici PST-78]|uniref:Uncharacterized protein n=1 Tax=Puccinia striiformis f. sp. tritici PST-78 TaxID=1165861 RepID=A0A0L0W2X0_9BASI|nr:hypothetical protein PSTG_00882 [Puccinia striiformis f. sp. tritici PST-78]
MVLTRALTRRSNLTPPPTDNPPVIQKPSKKKKASSPNLVHPEQSSTDQIGGTRHISTVLTKAHHPPPSRQLPAAAQTQTSPKNRPKNSPQSKQTPPSSHSTSSPTASSSSIPDASEDIPEDLQSSNPDVSESICSSTSEKPSEYTQAQRKLEAIVTAIPEDLLFFLSPQILYRQATVKKLLRIIQLVFPSVEFRGSPDKSSLFNYFQDHVAPLFATYRETKGNQYIENRHSGIDVDHIDVHNFDPTKRTSTKAIIGALIHKVNPDLKTANLNKATLTSIFYQVYNLPTFRPPRKFSVVPLPIESPLHSEQGKNNLRFAIQGYFPSLYILIECDHDQLAAIYQLLILEDKTNAHRVQENVHYYWFNPEIPVAYQASLFLANSFEI